MTIQRLGVPEISKAKEMTFEHLAAGWSFIVGDYKSLTPTIRCADGSRISAQASRTHGCTPKDNFGPYTSLEVYFRANETKLPPASWGRYRNPVESRLFDYVPTEMVRALIEERGGQVQ